MEVTWKSWLQSLLRGYGALQNRCDRVAVGGFSLGGVLALMLATRQRPNLAGVFTINAPMRLRDFRAGLVPMLVQWNKLARATRLTDALASRLNDQSESPDINYPVDYLHGLRELRRAVSACRSELRRVSAPALIIQAEDDPVVRPESAQVILDRIGSVQKQLIHLPLDKHVIVRGENATPIAASIGDFLDTLKAGYAGGGAVADAS
jgi:esterase/lipase